MYLHPPKYDQDADEPENGRMKKWKVYLIIGVVLMVVACLGFIGFGVWWVVNSSTNSSTNSAQPPSTSSSNAATGLVFSKPGSSSSVVSASSNVASSVSSNVAIKTPIQTTSSPISIAPQVSIPPSGDSNVPVALRVANLRSAVVSVYWVDFEGSPGFALTIGPGVTLETGGTFVSHVYVAREGINDWTAPLVVVYTVPQPDADGSTLWTIS